MVPLSSCLIWQLISFILPPNKYGCLYAWTTLENIACDRLTDNFFYPSAERIWLCIRLDNAGKYCDITLKIMAMLQNVCKNCVRILEEEKHRQLRMFVILWKKRKKLASSSINQSVKSQNSAYIREYICCGRKCVWSTQQHQFTIVLNNLKFRRHRILHKGLGMMT